MASPVPARLPWVDHLRTFAIFLVVAQHACVTYSHVGSWYFMSHHEPAMPVKLVFLFWEGHAQSFFMGLLFLLAGYFAHFSLQRRGPGGFMRERLVRLGLPTLFYMLVIHPFILLGLNPWHANFPPVAEFYSRRVLSGEFLGNSGPLWFTFALLIFCALLAGWRALRPAPAADTTPPPAAGKFWLLACGLAISTFLVRTVQPIGISVMNFQLCFFPQYIVAFILGLSAARHGWLLPLARSPIAARAGWLGLIGGPVVLFAVLMLGGPMPEGDNNPFFGGWHGQAFGLAVWEQFAGVGLALGLLAVFSRKFDRDTPVLRWLADRSFAVYVLHAPVLVALTMAFTPLEPAAGPFLMAGLVAVTGLAVSYLLADLARRVPGLRSIL